jgi:hypothetical protein
MGDNTDTGNINQNDEHAVISNAAHGSPDQETDKSHVDGDTGRDSGDKIDP